MTLYTTDYLEYYLTLVGWIISNGVWNTLADTGLFAVPFFAIVLQEWIRARAEGADEGNKGVLSALRIENRVWIAVVVLLFAELPLITINVSTIDFDNSRSQQCQTYTPAGPAPAQTGWGASFTELNNQSAKVPIWWFGVHALSKAFTSSAVAGIPCGTDLRQMRMEVNETRINDPVLAQEVSDFTRDCYAPARAKLFQNRPQLDDAAAYDVGWIGSQTFLDDDEYYGAFHSSTPRADFPYNATRDAGLAQVASGGGYPTCSEWWNNSSSGLRSRVLGVVKPSLLQRFGQWASVLSQDEVNNSVLRSVVAPQQQQMTKGQVYADYGGQIGQTLANGVTRTASDLGLTVGSLAQFPAMDKVRQALPMVLAFIKMAMVICIPLILVFGTYGLRTLMTLTIIFFAIYFVEFWFQLARWVDSTIIDTLYGMNTPHFSLNPLMGLNNAMGDMLLNWVMAAMFIVLPLFWMGALSWAGISAGNALGGLTGATGDIQKAGGLAANAAVKAATKGGK